MKTLITDDDGDDDGPGNLTIQKIKDQDRRSISVSEKTGSYRVTYHDIPTLTGHKRVIGRSDRSLDKTIARYGSPP